MYAVIQAGGRQYTVKPAALIEVNHLDAEEGEAFETDKVLMLHPQGENIRLGAPYVKGATVKGVILRQFRGPKVLIFKHRRRKDYRRIRGHRQELTLVRIERIEAEGVSAVVEKFATRKPATAAATTAAAKPAAAAAKPKAATPAAAKPAATASPKAATAAAKPKAATKNPKD